MAFMGSCQILQIRAAAGSQLVAGQQDELSMRSDVSYMALVFYHDGQSVTAIERRFDGSVICQAVNCNG